MRNNKSFFIKLVGVTLFIFFVGLSLKYFHLETLIQAGRGFWEDSFLFFGTWLAYTLAFLLRAWAWKMYIPQRVKYINCIQGVFLSLFINHLIPVKAGDLFRAGFLSAKEKDLSFDESAHSVIVMRTLDVMVLISITSVGLFILGKNIALQFPGWMIASFSLLLLIMILIIHHYFRWFIKKHVSIFKQAFTQKSIASIVLLIFSSWILESFVIWNVAISMKMPLTFLQSVWVNSLTVGGQVFQITPGGISTYESVMTTALTILGFGVKEAYSAAIISHSFKFIFSYFTGLLLIFLSPAYLAGELRKIGLWRKKDFNEKRI